MIDQSPFRRKPFLSFKDRDLNSKNPIIRPATLAEIEAMPAFDLTGRDRYFLKEILKDQFKLPGLVYNAPAIAAGATLLDVINELGFKGKVVHKTVDNKTYVIIKGLAKDRTILKGTRYLNTHPDIVRLGLAKVSFQELSKKGFKSSVLIYGGIKTLEGVKLYFENKLNSSFFFEIGSAIPKIAITALTTAALSTAMSGIVATAGLPVAVGTGIVIVIGFGTGLFLEYFDKKVSFTEKFTESVETMWKNLQKNTQNQNPVTQSNLLEGLTFGTPYPKSPQMTLKGGLFVYTA